MKQLIMAALAVSLSTGAMAQSNKSDEEVKNLKLYYTSVDCAAAAGGLPIYDKSVTEAQKGDYMDQATTWLLIAGAIDDKIGRSIDEDFEQEAFRNVAMVELIGTNAMVTRLKVVHAECNKIYEQLNKD